MNVYLSNDDLSEEALSTLGPRDRALVEAAVLIIAAKQTLETYEPLYARMLNAQADLLLEPAKLKKKAQAETIAARLKEEVDDIATEIIKLQEN